MAPDPVYSVAFCLLLACCKHMSHGCSESSVSHTEWPMDLNASAPLSALRKFHQSEQRFEGPDALAAVCTILIVRPDFDHAFALAS